jgi:hypothetical protein
VIGSRPSSLAFRYDGVVTYATAVRELFVRMPDLDPLYRERFSYLGGEDLPYVVFGAFLIPVLETALDEQNAERVRSICSYLEKAAANATADAGLEQLLRVEIGEWLNGTAWESEVSSMLGDETKRICRYAPGLGAQRASLRQQAGDSPRR